MPRHSKNNTARGDFTSAEKSKLTYGTKKVRLGRDSMRDYNACFLCLQKALQPVCCYQGHLACKMCIYENILAQKKKIAQTKAVNEAQKELIQSQEQEKLEKEEAKRVELFRETQTSVLSVGKDKTSNSSRSSATTRVIDGVIMKVKDTPDGGQIFVADDRKEKEAEKVESGTTINDTHMRNVKVAHNFWVSSAIPQADTKPDIDGKSLKKDRVVCMICEHDLSLKKLVEVKFSESKDKKEYLCTGCTRTLNNGSKCVVMKPCGHVLCKECTTKFVVKSLKCMLCDTKVKSKDMIELATEGTGFAHNGNVEAERYAFAMN